MAVIIAASLGILAGAGATSPFIAGSLGIVAGAAVATGNILPPQADTEDGGPEMAERVQSAFVELTRYIDDANAAVFGKSGATQDLVPVEFRKEVYENPAIAAMGDGQWLQADPTVGLREAMDHMYHRMVSSPSRFR